MTGDPYPGEAVLLYTPLLCSWFSKGLMTGGLMMELVVANDDGLVRKARTIYYQGDVASERERK